MPLASTDFVLDPLFVLKRIMGLSWRPKCLPAGLVVGVSCDSLYEVELVKKHMLARLALSRSKHQCLHLMLKPFNKAPPNLQRNDHNETEIAQTLGIT